MFGREKVGRCYLYPSDHFGLRAEVEVGKRWRGRGIKDKEEVEGRSMGRIK
jgi:hypothetical protein